MRRPAIAITVFAMLSVAPWCHANDTSTAQESQNPLSTTVTFPIEYKPTFDVGPNDDTVQTALFKPVYPMKFNERWNFIPRSIIPLIHQPGGVTGTSGAGSESGLGDIQVTGFFSPSEAGKWLWGLGPTVTMPTASDDRLGAGKWSVGPAIAVLRIDGPWVYGFLAQNTWSIGGDSDRSDVNQLFVQPFVTYNFDRGWYVTSAPAITADWKARSSQRWTVPLGLGVGRLFRIGEQVVTFEVVPFVNVVKPDGAGDWSLSAQFKFIFPK